MTSYLSKETYSSIFHLLLGRKLSDEDYSTHFSCLDLPSYIASLLDSSEFVEKNIFPFMEDLAMPIVNHKEFSANSNNNRAQHGLFPAVVLCFQGLQTLKPGQFTRQEHRYFPISCLQRINTDEHANALQVIDTQKLQQALQASAGPVDLCMARDTLLPFLKKPQDVSIADSKHSERLTLELVFLPSSLTFRRYSFYASLFTSLLGRSLTREEFDLHFSSLSSLEYLSLLLQSTECLAKNIFETLPSCTCARITNPKQLVVQLPGALDDGVYIVLSIGSKRSITIAIRMRPASIVIESLSEPENLNSTDAIFLPDTITASLIQHNSFTHEDFLSVVSNFSISSQVDVETMISLQSSYQLPPLAGIFTATSSCAVSLITATQLIDLAESSDWRKDLDFVIAN